jgi:hypothetical protein
VLRPPPSEPASLEHLPRHHIGGTELFRVWRSGLPVDRPEPWWFSSRTGASGGRFDLPSPAGTLSTSTRRVGAVLEALQACLTNLPIEELEVRTIATIAVPESAPPAADLCHRSVAGRGVTAGVWAGADRDLTQQWAAAVRRDGWWALHAGVHQDPSGRLRAVAVFGAAGDGAPKLGGTWSYRAATLHDDPSIAAELARLGVAVRGPGELPFTEIEG